jgi:hypothetical protein
MNRSVKALSALTGLGLYLMTASQSVWAGAAGAGTIVYSPDVQQAVPTLSGWTLIVLGLLFGIIAFRVMRHKQHGRTLASLAAAGIMAAGASTGVKLIEEGHAANIAILLNIDTGSSVSISLGLTEYQNTTNVTQRIRSISYTGVCGRSLPAPSETECTIGLPIPPTESCWLNTECPPNLQQNLG